MKIQFLRVFYKQFEKNKLASGIVFCVLLSSSHKQKKKMELHGVEIVDIINVSLSTQRFLLSNVEIKLG